MKHLATIFAVVAAIAASAAIDLKKAKADIDALNARVDATVKKRDFKAYKKLFLEVTLPTYTYVSSKGEKSTRDQSLENQEWVFQLLRAVKESTSKVESVEEVQRKIVAIERSTFLGTLGEPDGSGKTVELRTEDRFETTYVYQSGKLKVASTKSLSSKKWLDGKPLTGG